MAIESVDDPNDERLAGFRSLPDPELLRRGDVFVAEGRLVVRALLTQSRLRTRSVLVTRNAYRQLADAIDPSLPGLPVYLVPDGLIEQLTGFNIQRGCLALGERPARAGVAELLGRLASPRRLVVIEQIANADNVGGIFRNAAAFGADAVVVGPNCCDPLYRKAIRVSMGAALRVPFCHAENWSDDLERLRSAGFALAALTPAPAAVDIAAWAPSRPERLAILAGSEGSGLSEASLKRADVCLRIPMAAGTDSLNVATATGIALHACFP